MVGTIEGSHIPLKTVPVNEQIEYFNCKQDYSIVVQAVANASFKFLDVSTGFPGSIHYAHILQLSKLHREASRGNWLNGPNKLGPVKWDLCLLGTQLIPYRSG